MCQKVAYRRQGSSTGAADAAAEYRLLRARPAAPNASVPAELTLRCMRVI